MINNEKNSTKMLTLNMGKVTPVFEFFFVVALWQDKIAVH